MKETLLVLAFFFGGFIGGFGGAVFGQIVVWLGFFRKNLRDKWGMWPRKTKVK